MALKKLLSLTTAASLAMIMFTGCDAETDTETEYETQYVKESTGEIVSSDNVVYPFERVAVIDGGSWTEVGTIAAAIAEYVDTTDENATLDYPSNWIVGGDVDKDGNAIAAADRILGIPKVYDGVGQKIKVIELCNKAYAIQATGTGRFHGPALPCEVSVHYDSVANKTYVDMLNADAIFSLFFADLSDEQKASLGSVASAVKSEIEGMVEAALTANGTAYTASNEGLGQAYPTTGDMGGAATINPYIVYQYKLDDNSSVSGLDATIAQAIIDIMGGTDETGQTSHTNVPGLSSGALWRSGRPAPLPIPGVKIVEACSPKYAKMATAMGAEYVTALPCEIGVYVDETDTTGTTLSITFLNPTFMFNVMFADALNAMSDSEKLTYSTLPDVVYADLRAIVNAAIDTHNASATTDLVIK